MSSTPEQRQLIQTLKDVNERMPLVKGPAAEVIAAHRAEHAAAFGAVLDDCAEADRLRARVEKLEAELHEIERQIPPDYGGTHYDGCEKHHPWCAVAKAVRRAALVGGE